MLGGGIPSAKSEAPFDKLRAGFRAPRVGEESSGFPGLKIETGGTQRGFCERADRI